MIQSLCVFIGIFCLTLIIQKIAGFKNIYKTSVEPVSWDEVINHIPIDLLSSFCFALFAYYIFWSISKQGKKKNGI